MASSRGTEASYRDEFMRFIDCLDRAGCLQDVMVIGSWAEYAYARCGLIEGFDPQMKTLDADFLIPDLHRPREKASLTSIAKEEGFAYDEGRDTGASRFYGRDAFEIEFLTPQKGDGSRRPPRANVGVNAQQLKHMGILSENRIEAELEGRRIAIPTPEAYVMHKMVINHERGLKAAPDRDKINGLLPYLEEKEMTRIYQGMFRSEQKYLAGYVDRYCPAVSIKDGHMSISPYIRASARDGERSGHGAQGGRRRTEGKEDGMQERMPIAGISRTCDDGHRDAPPVPPITAHPSHDGSLAPIPPTEAHPSRDGSAHGMPPSWSQGPAPEGAALAREVSRIARDGAWKDMPEGHRLALRDAILKDGEAMDAIAEGTGSGTAAILKEMLEQGGLSPEDEATLKSLVMDRARAELSEVQREGHLERLAPQGHGDMDMDRGAPKKESR